MAQVLDYARALVRWSYSDLQRQVSVALGRRGNVPFELARSANASVSEHQYVDAVTRNLRAGRFLTIVIGDGIREDIAALTALINQNAALGLSFGLVELALYDFGPHGLALQPRVPLRTHVVERNVLVLPGGAALIDADAEADNTAFDHSVAAGKANGNPKQAAYKVW